MSCRKKQKKKIEIAIRIRPALPHCSDGRAPRRQLLQPINTHKQIHFSSDVRRLEYSRLDGASGASGASGGPPGGNWWQLQSVYGRWPQQWTNQLNNNQNKPKYKPLSLSSSPLLLPPYPPTLPPYPSSTSTQAEVAIINAVRKREECQPGDSSANREIETIHKTLPEDY